jgi:tRNA-Thr(GGU) m(6)t(6)A37 methyltransferase TsaA
MRLRRSTTHVGGPIAMTDPITFRPIGVIRTPFATIEGMPVQAALGSAVGVAGTIELDPELADALADLDGFSHITLLYHLDRVGPTKLSVVPFLDNRPHGLFATRSPARPNPIGLSTVRLTGIEGATLRIEDVDILDGTPLLDIKPYVPALDDRSDVRIGWYADRLAEMRDATSDRRFGPGR